MTVEELAKEIEDYAKGGGKDWLTKGDLAEFLLSRFRIERIDPMKQCYLDEGQCKCQIPQICVMGDDDMVVDCRIATDLSREGKTRDDCPHWGKIS